MKDNPIVYIVILNWNGLNDTIECIESLKKIKNRIFKIILVDNASKNNEAEILVSKFGSFIYLIKNKINLGFAEGNNIGIKYALNFNPDYILLLNNDTVVKSNFLDEMLKFIRKNNNIGVLGNRIISYYEPKNIWFSGGYINWWRGFAEHFSKKLNFKREIDFVSGCCMLLNLKKIIYSDLFFDKRYFCLYEDVDLCFRIKKRGLNLNICNSSIIWHKISRSSGSRYSPFSIYYGLRNRMLFMKKHATYCQKIFFYPYIFLCLLSYYPYLSLKYRNIYILKSAFLGFRDFMLKRFGLGFSKEWWKNNKKKTILSTNFFLYPDEFGGSYNLAHEININLVLTGINVVEVSINPNNKLASQEIVDGIERFRVSITKSKNRFVRLISEIINFRKKINFVLKNYNIKIIHIHDFISGFAVLLSSRQKDCKLIYHYHGSFLQEEKSNFWKNIEYKNIIIQFIGKIYFLILGFAYKQVLKKMNKFIVLSDYSFNNLKLETEIGKRKIYKIPAAINLNKFKLSPSKLQAKSLLKLPTDRIILLTVRRLANRMGLEELIKAISLLPKNLRKKILLLIGGKGDLKNDLLLLRDKLNLQKNVSFIGFVGDKDLALYYRAADLFILPTKELEGFGIVILEAAASGTPVIGTNVGAIKETLNYFGKNLLIKDCNEKLIAAKIKEFIGSQNKIDENLLRNLVCKRYNWNKIINQVRNVYFSDSR